MLSRYMGSAISNAAWTTAVLILGISPSFVIGCSDKPRKDICKPGIRYYSHALYQKHTHIFRPRNPIEKKNIDGLERYVIAECDGEGRPTLVMNVLDGLPKRWHEYTYHEKMHVFTWTTVDVKSSTKRIIEYPLKGVGVTSSSKGLITAKDVPLKSHIPGFDAAAFDEKNKEYKKR